MIDFQNGSVIKLHQGDPTYGTKMVELLMIQNEQVINVFNGARDTVVFTNMRIIAVNVQGITGKKKDFSSLPYSKIQAFSVETAGTFDLDCELELWFSGLGKVKFEFSGKTDIRAIGQTIGYYTMK